MNQKEKWKKKFKQWSLSHSESHVFEQFSHLIVVFQAVLYHRRDDSALFLVSSHISWNFQQLCCQVLQNCAHVYCWIRSNSLTHESILQVPSDPSYWEDQTGFWSFWSTCDYFTNFWSFSSWSRDYSWFRSLKSTGCCIKRPSSR